MGHFPQMAETVKIRAAVMQALLAEARRNSWQECCGFLAGRDGVITATLSAANLLASPSAYEIGPVELFRLVREMRAQNLEHLGIYHSHPAGENAPSPRDIERAFYPDVAYLIVSPRPDATQPVRGFSIRGGKVNEFAIAVVQPGSGETKT